MFLNLLIVGSIFQTLHVRGSSSEVLQDSSRIYDAKHKLQPGANYLSISFLKSPISRTTSTDCIFTLMEKRTQWRSRTFPRYRRSWAWNWNLLIVSRLATNQWKAGLWEQRCLIGTLRSDLNKRGLKNNRQEDYQTNFDNMMICLWMYDLLFDQMILWPKLNSDSRWSTRGRSHSSKQFQWWKNGKRTNSCPRAGGESINRIYFAPQGALSPIRCATVVFEIFTQPNATESQHLL